MAIRAVDLGDAGGAETAAAAIAAGEAVAVDNDAVWALWGDARQPSFHEHVRAIKGDARANRPVALSVSSAMFLGWADVAGVAVAWRPLLSDPELLSSLLGALCFLRVPLRGTAAAELPREVVGSDGATATIQNYDPAGKTTTDRIVTAVVAAAPRSLPAVTSLNRTGEPSITEESRAVELLSRHPTTLLVTDRAARRRGLGSYPMIAVDGSGATLLRHGCVPDSILAAILRPVVADPLRGVRADATGPVPFAETGREMRTAYLRYRGWNAD